MILKIMTLNLRYDKPDPDDQAWRVRRNAVRALIHHHHPDIIGTQEGKSHQLLDLHRLLPEYQSVGGDRTGRGTDEYCAIFYHPHRLRCEGHGDFFLSHTPEIPGSISVDWGNLLPRMVSWAVLSVRDLSKPITLFNTHLDYKSAKARELSVKLIRDRLTQLSPESTYVFVTGDFNADPDSVPRQVLSQPLANTITLQDALADLDLADQLSFHDFSGRAFAAIDTIYYDSRMTRYAVKIDREKWFGIWPSDHFAVIAEFDLR